MAALRDGPAARILIVDDHRAVREELAFALGYAGYQVLEAADGAAALAAAAATPAPDLVLLDVKLPGMDGLEVLDRLAALLPGLPIVMVSGHGDLDTAVLAVRRGAHDFLAKPVAADRLLLSVRNALSVAKLRGENAALRQALSAGPELLGDSAAMVAVRGLLDKVAPTDVTVLVTGENGTGKELAARRLHHRSPRSRQPFVAVNCAAIPLDLVESELFGHERGAFTGAIGARAGAFQQADGGTLFLDEIGDMPLAMQAKLLRALQDGVVQRLGSERPEPVDVRLVAATNQDLEALVASRQFREDLYYRLHVVRVHLPALRDRPEDIATLARHFLAEACSRNRLPNRRLGAAARDWLAAQPWPGNVRQLKNLLEGAAVLAEQDELAPADLVAVGTSPPGRGTAGVVDWFAYERLEDFRSATEKEFLRRKLLENQGNIKRTAERIELQRSNLYKKLERYGLK